MITKELIFVLVPLILILLVFTLILVSFNNSYISVYQSLCKSLEGNYINYSYNNYTCISIKDNSTIDINKILNSTALSEL